MAATDYSERYRRKRTFIESTFKQQADSILEQAKAAYDELQESPRNSRGIPDKQSEFIEKRGSLTRKLDRIKENAVKEIGLMCREMSSDVAAAWAKPMDSAQSSAMNAARTVGVDKDNATGLFCAAKGNAMAMDALRKMADFSKIPIENPKPVPLSDLREKIARIEKNRTDAVSRYGGVHDVGLPGASADYFGSMLTPGGYLAPFDEVLSFLDEYGA